MEKIKDIIYDISDIVVSLLIVAVIFIIVSWKLSDSMSFNDMGSKYAKNDPKNSTQTEQPAGTTDGSADGTDATDAEVITVDPTKPQNNTGTAATTGTTGSTDGGKPTGTTPAGTQPTTPTTTPTVAAGKDVVLEIPSGASGFSIAKQLKEKGLITDTSAFIKRVEELKLGVKLRSGSFTLKTGMTMDQVIYKLTGQTPKQ